MSNKVSLSYGDKVALYQSKTNASGFVNTTNSSQCPAAVTLLQTGQRIPPNFENCIFQILSGDGDIKNCVSFNRGQPVLYGQCIRLLHVKTFTLLCCNKKTKAYKEKANFKVTFEGVSDEAKGNRWRMMPKYKVRGEGERVCGDDEVVLQLHGYQLFLHTCSAPMEAEGETQRILFEINATAIQESAGTGFLVHTYDVSRMVETKKLNRFVSGGDCVILFHKQETGPLTCGRKTDGSAFTHIEPAQPEWTTSVVKSTTTSITSTALFLTEFEDTLRGGVITVGQGKTYRLKSLATGEYLCVTERKSDEMDDEIYVEAAPAESVVYDATMTPTAADSATVLDSLCLTLTPDASQPGTLFSLYQTTDDPETKLRSGTRVLMQAPRVGITGVWVTSGKPIANTRQSVIKLTGPNKTISLCTQPMQKDAFEIRVVEKDTYQQLYFVLNLLPSLHMYANYFAKGQLPTEQILHTTKDSFIQLIKYCSASSEQNPFERDGIPIAINQRMLVDQNVPELCVHVFRSTFLPTTVGALTPDLLAMNGIIPKSDGIRYSEVRDICRLALCLARLCAKDNPIGGLQLIEHMKPLMGYINFGFGILPCMIAICSGNDQIIDTPDDPSLVNFGITQCMEHPYSPRFLTFLSTLCVSKGKSIPANQNFLAENFFSKCANVLVSFTVEGSEVFVCTSVNPKTNETTSYKESIWTFFAPDESTSDKHVSSNDLRENVTSVTRRTMQEYVTQFIQFVGSVSWGRNAAGIEIARKHFPMESLVNILLNAHDKLLSQEVVFVLLRLLHHVYVDVDPYRVLEMDVIVKVWGRLEANIMAKQEGGMPAILEPMQRSLVTYLGKNPCLSYRPQDSHKNEVLLETLNLLSTMLNFQWTSPTDIVSIFNSCVQVLRTQNDILPSELSNLALLQPQQPFDRYALTENSLLVIRCKERAVEMLSLIFDLHCHHSVQDFLLAFEKANPPPHFSQIFDVNISTKLHTLSKENVEVENKNMLMGGIGAVKDFGGNLVGGVASLTKGVVGKIVPLGGEVKNPYQELIDLHEALFEGTLFKYDSLATKSLQMVLRFFNFPAEVNKCLKRVQLLSNERSIELFKASYILFEKLRARASHKISLTRVNETVDTLSGLCDKLAPTEDMVLETQTMFMNLGLHEMVITILRNIVYRGIPKQRPLRGVIEMCYKLLAMMCSGNTEISAAVFIHNELFSQHLEYDVGVIELLVVILDESIELCNLIPESLLRQVVNVMVERECYPLYVLFLRKIIWIDDKPVQRIQELLWKIIAEKHMSAESSQGKLLQMYDVWTREKGIANRNTLLEAREYENPDGKMSFHLQWISLLHAVVKGKDLRIKRELSSIAFQSSGVAEVLEIVSNRSLPVFYRAPYLRLFHEVFVDDKSNQMVIMDEKETLITLVQVVTEDIKRVIEVFRKTAKPEKIEDFTTALRQVTPNDPTDVETRVSYITLIVPQLVRHLLVNIVPMEDINPNFQRDFYQALGVLAETFIEWIEIDQMNSSDNAASFAIPLVSPTRRISGKRNVAIIFPSEQTSSILDTDTCVYRLTPQERKNIKNMFVEFVQRGVGTDPHPPGRPHTAALEDMITKLQKDLNVQPLARSMFNRRGSLGDDGRMFARWNAFVKDHLDNVNVREEGRYSCFALNVLKMGRHSETIIRTIVTLLRSHVLADNVRKDVFIALERFFDVEDKHRRNDIWILHPEILPQAVEDSEGSFELLIHKSTEDRQCIINRVSPLAAILVELTGRNDTVAQSAMKLGIAFLDGGNLEVQMSFYQYCMEKSDEDFFQTNRNRLTYFQTVMKEKKQSIKRILGSKEQAVGPLPDSVVEKVRTPEFEIIIRNLRFLQLLVEGHNLLLQDYLRIQRDNQVSVDVVEACAALLISILRSRVDRVSLDVCMQNIATLTEFIQGPCVGNQQRLINSNIGEGITLSLRSTWADLTEEQNWSFKQAIVVMLLALIEGKISIPLAVELIQSLSLEALANVMDSSYQRWESKQNNGPALLKGVAVGVNIVKGLIDPTGGKDGEDGIDLGCFTFIFFKAMVDIVGRTPGQNPDEYWAHIVDRDGKSVKDTLRTHLSYRFFNTLVGSIEINRHSSIEKVYFRVPEAAKKNLRKASREDLLKDVDRDSLSTKLNDFFEKAQDLIFEIKFFEELSKTRGLAVIHEYYPYFDNVSILLSIVVNLFLLFSVNSEEYYTNSQEIPGHRVYEFYYVLGYIIVAVQGCLTLHFLFGSLRIHIEYSWRSWEQSLRDEAVKESKANMALDAPIFVENAKDKLLYPEYILRTLGFIALFWPFWQRVLFMVASVLGTEVHPFFFSLQLLQCIQKSPQLQNVVLAVTKNGKNLLLTLMLMLVFVYMFSLLAYYELSEAMSNGDLGDGFQCDTMLKCFMLMSTYGLRAGGGIGDFMSPPKWNDHSNGLAARVLFDMLFFALLIIIFMNIVFGIIIDTFAELREARQSMEDDQTGTCFMCGIDKATLDRQAASSGGFDSHVDYDHNMWQYLYYMYYLTTQKVDELNGQEFYAHQMMKKRDITFFPMGRALVLRDDIDNVENTQEHLMLSKEEIQQMLNQISNSVNGQFVDLKVALEKIASEKHNNASAVPGNSFR